MNWTKQRLSRIDELLDRCTGGALVRARDEADVVELLRVNPEQIDSIRQHLGNVHLDYVCMFDQLVKKAREQRDPVKGQTQ